MGLGKGGTPFGLEPLEVKVGWDVQFLGPGGESKCQARQSLSGMLRKDLWRCGKPRWAFEQRERGRAAGRTVDLSYLLGDARPIPKGGSRVQ